MRFDVVTLFPELFTPHLTQGVTRRAFESGQVDVKLWPLRDFADGNYRRVDDRPFGGGPGMVLLAEPLERALSAVRVSRAESDPVPLVHFTPTGRPIDQALVRELSTGPGAVLLCGRYEGIDQRFIDRHVTLELSLGDFVLSGGELPALALLDALARLQPGVLGDAQSHEQDSFSDGLLDCPHYSRPEQLEGDGAGEAVRPPRRHRTLAPPAVARADGTAPAGPAGGSPCGRATLIRRRAVPRLARAIITGFSILCRAGTCGSTPPT
jgi:tRNA (guanine37-N1)-methyltransferase